MYFSATTGILLLSVLLLLLHNTPCLSTGERCNKFGSNECDQGLACVAVSVDSDIAFCELIDGCEIFGCKEESGECICRTETNCLASFSFSSLDECQSSLKDAIRQPCDLATCPSVWCGPSLQYTPEGKCCPVCPPPPVAIFPPSISNPAGCTENGVQYNEGGTWQRDACITCTCEAGIPLCSTVSCLPLTCTNPIQLPGHCCPTCPPQAVAPALVFIYPAPPSNKCRDSNNNIYKDGESWVPDKTNPCLRGYCDEGEIFHLSRQCGVPECENPIYSEDTCCPRCPGDEEDRDIRQAQISASSPKSLRALRSVSKDTVLTSEPEEVANGDLSEEDSTATAHPPTQACIVNDQIMQEGESYCPRPDVIGICYSGEVLYSHHCEPINCSNPINGRIGTCNCPVCLGEIRRFQVAALLEMSVHEFAFKAQEINEMISSLVADAGLYLEYNLISIYNYHQMRIVMAVITSNLSATEDDVVGAVHDEMESKNHEGMVIGHVVDFPMPTEGMERKRSIRSADSVSVSTNSDTLPSSNTQHSSTSTIIAVTASVCGVVASVIGIALFTSYVHRKQTIHKTITV